jgi:hypothetical protein
MLGNLCFETFLAFVDAHTIDEYKYPRGTGRIYGMVDPEVWPPLPADEPAEEPLGPPPPQWRLPRARGVKKNNPQQTPASFLAQEGGDNPPPPDAPPPASNDDSDTPGQTTEGTTAAGAAADSPSGGRQEEHKGGSQPQTRSRAGKPRRHQQQQQQQQQGQGAQQADAAATATATATKSPLSSNRDDNGDGNINRGDHGPSTPPNKESQRQHHQTGNKKRPRTPIPDDDSGPACKARRSPACRPRSGGI